MTVLKLIDSATCLLLDKRYDAKNRIQAEWKQRGIDVDFFITGNGDHDLQYNNINDNVKPPIYPNSIKYATWYNRPNPFNAWKSMRKIWSQFLDTDGNIFLFLEDDSFIENDFDTILKESEKFILNTDWDILYLGGYYKNKLSDVGHKYVKKTNGSMGFHGVILTRKILGLMIKFEPHGPFDYMVSNRIHPFYNCYAIYPSIVSQKSGESNIEGHHLDKPSRYEK